MDADPGQVIRSLRLALEMSQSEFARAAGWAPSTISSWERGRAKPSRLAFKTILAFAEERGVRYRPPTASKALVPLPSSPAGGDTFGTGTPGPRAAFRPLLYPDRPQPYPPPAHRPDAQRMEAPHAEPPRWSAEANFRLTLGPRHDGRTVLGRRLIEIAIVALGFCAAFGLRDSVRHLLHPGASASQEARASISPAAPAAAAPPSVAAASLAPHVAAPLDIARVGDAATSDDRQSLPAPPSAAASRDTTPHTTGDAARLESVMTIGGAGRATFRTANDAVTVAPGEWLGGLRVVAVGSDGVTLVDRQGDRHRVQVGQHAPSD